MDQFVKVLVYFIFRNRIKCCRRFIKNNYRCILIQCSCDGKFLSLTAYNADIAISVMLELGDNANYLIRQILDAYYGTGSSPEPTEEETVSSALPE